MSTASFNWTAWDTTNAWENLADAGNSASVTYSRDATDIAAKFVQATKATTQTEFGRKSGAGDTWASIFGISAGATVTQIQVSAWKKKLVSVTKLSSHSVTIALIDDSGARVTATDSISGVALGTTADGSYVAQTAGSTVNVNAGSQAASTNVRLSLEYTVTTSGGGGSANVDQRFDDITITITYTAGPIPKSLSDSLGFSPSLAKQDKKSLTASLTFSPTLAKQTKKPLAGSLSFSPSLSEIKLVAKSLSASLGFTTSLVKRANKSLTANLGFTSSLVRKTGKKLSASLSFSPVLAKQTRLALSGTLGFSQNLTKRVGKKLSTSLSFSTSLTRLKATGKALADSLTFSPSMTPVKHGGGGASRWGKHVDLVELTRVQGKGDIR